MKALVRHSDTPKDFSLGQVPEPSVAPGKVKIKVAYAGVCGSDLHIYLGFEPGLPQGVHGHEFSGVITEVGEGVTGFAPGDAVTAEHTYYTCGRCEYCRTGRYQLCAGRKSLGFEIQGAFAEYVVTDPLYVHKLPDGFDLKKAALTEPLACILHAIRLIEVKPAQPVLVVGPGPMGLLCALTLKAFGCSVDIMGAPQDGERLERAAKAGIRVVNGDAVEEKSYPVVAECSGSAGGIRFAIRALQKGGTLLQVGIATGDVPLPYDQLVFKELKIQGTFCHTWPDWDQALKMQQAGLLDISPVITDVVSIDGWKDAFEGLIEKKGMKTLFAF